MPLPRPFQTSRCKWPYRLPSPSDSPESSRSPPRTSAPTETKSHPPRCTTDTCPLAFAVAQSPPDKPVADNKTVRCCTRAAPALPALPAAAASLPSTACCPDTAISPTGILLPPASHACNPDQPSPSADNECSRPSAPLPRLPACSGRKSRNPCTQSPPAAAPSNRPPHTMNPPPPAWRAQ